MQEEKFEEKEQQPLSVFELFAAAEETYEEAQARAAEENKSFVKTEFIKMDKFGTYTFRILPIAPKADGTIDRKSYEYPIHQLLMKIQKPSDNGKQQFTYVSVCRAGYAGTRQTLLTLTANWQSQKPKRRMTTSLQKNWTMVPRRCQIRLLTCHVRVRYGRTCKRHPASSSQSFTIQDFGLM